MDRASVIATLKSLEPRLRAQGVAALYLYGSYARDEARPDSDIDLLVDPADDTTFGLSRSMDAAELVGKELPDTEVSLFTRDNIVPLYLPAIEASEIRVF